MIHIPIEQGLQPQHTRVSGTSPLRRELYRLFPTLKAGDSFNVSHLEEVAVSHARGIITPRKLAWRCYSAWSTWTKENGITSLRAHVGAVDDGQYRFYILKRENGS